MKIHDSHFLGAESCDSGMTHGHVSSFLPNRSGIPASSSCRARAFASELICFGIGKLDRWV